MEPKEKYKSPTKGGAGKYGRDYQTNFSKISLDEGADIRKIYSGGKTLLHLAAECDSEEVINYSIDKNLDVYARDKQGNSSLHIAAANNSTKAVKILSNTVLNDIKDNYEESKNKEIKNKEGRTPFLSACFETAFDRVIYLLENGANINETDNNSCNALHLLALFGGRRYRTDDRYINIFRQLIDRNCIDLNSVCKKGKTAMHYVVGSDIIEVLKMLLEHGANKEIKNEEGRTPFLLACSEKAFDCVIYLLENGANINETDNNGCNASHLLAFGGRRYRTDDRYINIFRQLIDRNCIDLNSICKKGKTAMHYVVGSGIIEALKMLLKHGADKEIKDNLGNTPFLLACYYKAFDCAIYLLENGANINETNNTGCNALHLLAFGGGREGDGCCIDIFRQLIDRNSIDLNSVCEKGMTAMHYVVGNDVIGILEILLEYGADKKIKDNQGRTPFVLACYRKAFNCATYLLEHVANINETDNNGCIALQLLAEEECNYSRDVRYIHNLRHLIDYDMLSVVGNHFMKRLFENGADKEGKTAMHYAVENDNIQILKILLEHGADEKIKDNQGRTSFLFACYGKKMECAIYLVKNSANIYETDNNGCNALHLLAFEGREYRTDDRYINIFRQLIYLNWTDLNSVCKEGKTVMHYAVENDNIQILEILLEHGANKEIKDNQGRTPFLLACSKNALDCAICLLEDDANIDETDNTGCNAFHILSKLVNLTDRGTILVTNLIKLNSINLDDVSNEGLTALQYAHRTGNLKMTYLLNQNNDDVEIVVDEN